MISTLLPLIPFESARLCGGNASGDYAWSLTVTDPKLQFHLSAHNLSIN